MQLLKEKPATWPIKTLKPKSSARPPELHRRFEHWARLLPEQPAVSHQNASMSYGELNLQANTLAARLIEKGVGPGDMVPIFMTRSIELVVSILGVLKTGAAYVPQDIRITPTKHLDHIVQQSKTKVVLTSDEFKYLVPLRSKCEPVSVSEIVQRREGTSSITSSSKALPIDALCFVLFTSGTTGVPNGVKVMHRNVANLLDSKFGGLGIRPGTKVGQILNVAFDMAAWEILGALTQGGTLVIRGKDIEETVSRVDTVIATPSILSSLNIDNCTNVKKVAVAGEPCPKSLAEKWSKFATFYNGCGPTEVTIVNTIHKFEPGTKSEKVSIGGPISNTSVYLLDENLKPTLPGEIGEMWAGGDCVTAGYLDNQKLTNERYRLDPFKPGRSLMFRTRDLGRWSESGELEHFGRIDDQVKVRGFRVELDSVSTALESFQAIKQAVTLKLDDRHLATFLTPADVNVAQIKERIKSLLPYYATPSIIVPLDTLPKTDRGKLDKRSLTKLAVKIHEERGKQ